MKKHVSVFLLCILAFILLSPTQSAQASVKLNKEKITISQGEYYDLKISGTNSNIKWTSNNKKIVTVTNSGKVYGIKPGTAFVTATVGKNQFTCRVMVASPTLNKYNLKLRYGGTHKFEIKNLPKDLSITDVSYTSSEPNIASIDSNGLLTALVPGYTQITVSLGKYKLRCGVNVQELSEDEKVLFDNNITKEYYEFDNRKVCLMKSDISSFNASYYVEYYDLNNSMVSVSRYYGIELFKGKEQIIEIPATDKPYTSYTIKLDNLYPITSDYLKNSQSNNAIIDVKISDPYFLSYTYYFNNLPIQDITETCDIIVNNKSNKRISLNFKLILYKDGKIVNVKYYNSHDIDIGESVIKEYTGYLTQPLYYSYYDNYKIIY